MKGKSAQYSPPTETAMKELFEPYRQAFPGWDVENNVVLSRRLGPLRQIIYIESLRYAAYRPAHSIELQMHIPDGCSLLQQWLDVKHRIVKLRQHATRWPLVLKAIEEQFVPSVRKPLEVAETVQLAEQQVQNDRIENINHLSGLAALNAYLGNTARAIYWCGRVEYRASNLGRPLGDWENRKVRFALALQGAIETGVHLEVLNDGEVP